MRTNEVYYLDPDAPMTRPSTHDPQHEQLNGTKIEFMRYRLMSYQHTELIFLKNLCPKETMNLQYCTKYLILPSYFLKTVQ